MADKLAFYDDHGVEEYYFFDPDSNALQGWGRRGSALVRVRPMHNFVSLRLGIRFDLSGPEMVVYRPDGRRFLTFEELEEERAQTAQRAEQAERRAGQAEDRAREAQDQAREAQDQAKQATERAKKAEHLAALSIKVLRQQATPEEAAELERLLQQPPGD
jgi:hypothetical protein